MVFNQELLVPYEYQNMPQRDRTKRKLEGASSANDTFAFNFTTRTNQDVVKLRLVPHGDDVIPQPFYELVEWTKDYMAFVLEFEDPLQVSRGETQDEIVVDVLKPELFRSAIYNHTLTDATLNGFIPS